MEQLKGIKAATTRRGLSGDHRQTARAALKGTAHGPAQAL